METKKVHLLPRSNLLIIISLILTIFSRNQENELIDSSSKVDIENTKKMSESERLEQRLKKFGAQNDNTKKEERAKRFGISASGGESNGGDGILKKRAERFGTAPSTPTGVDKETLEKRAKRFGSTELENSNNEALSKRKERFGIVDDDVRIFNSKFIFNFN